MIDNTRQRNKIAHLDETMQRVTLTTKATKGRSSAFYAVAWIPHGKIKRDMEVVVKYYDGYRKLKTDRIRASSISSLTPLGSVR